MDNWESLIEKLAAKDIAYIENECLAKHCTFKIGGNASLVCTVNDMAKLLWLSELFKTENVKYYILGKGSNVLFADEGFDGAIIKMAQQLCEISINGTELVAGAGADLAKVCMAARDAGLTGLEFAYGIPGSVGGAVYMNAGAYGGEMAQVVSNVEFIDDTDKVNTLPVSKLAYSYRNSIFQQNKWIISKASFSLMRGDKAQISAKMQELAKCRGEKQPLDMPSAGSTFKRPEGAFAAALIDKCNLRGFSVGGAAISEKHCGFVVNKGGATCADVLKLADEVCKIVHEKTGYNLEKEIRVVR
ncbi:MAG: UDP-N-acetylmuramate dehydrogenase [Oscillospiraceae bacterium]